MNIRRLSPGTPVSSTSKTDSHSITELLLKEALNTINPNPNMNIRGYSVFGIKTFTIFNIRLRSVQHDTTTASRWRLPPSCTSFTENIYFPDKYITR